jgi:hypothetical protein
MRVFLAFGLVCCCTVVAGADLETQVADTDSNADKTDTSKPKCDEPAAKDQKTLPTCEKEICDLLKCLDAKVGAIANEATKPAAIKIMAVKPNQVADAFADLDWYPSGQADVTRANWSVVREATWAALTEAAPHKREWYSPAVGLQFTVAEGGCGKQYPAGQYVLLLFFDTHSAELLYKESADKPATSKWRRQSHDNRPWRDILTNAGVSLTSKSTSSN